MNSTSSESTDYHAYLLRLWRDGPKRPWRASMRCAATGTCHHFADMAQLIAFLQDRTGDVDEQAIDEPSKKSNKRRFTLKG